MKLYIVKDANNNRYTYTAYFTNKKEADKYVKENDKPWTNINGIEWHTAYIFDIIETGKFY